MHLWRHNYVFISISLGGLDLSCLPLRACFLVVFLQQWPKPGTGLMSLLLTGGGCSTSLGGLVRHTGRAAALIRIPVIPEIWQRENERVRRGRKNKKKIFPLRFLMKFPKETVCTKLSRFQLSPSVTCSSPGLERVLLPASAG